MVALTTRIATLLMTFGAILAANSPLIVLCPGNDSFVGHSTYPKNPDIHKNLPRHDLLHCHDEATGSFPKEVKNVRVTIQDVILIPLADPAVPLVGVFAGEKCILKGQHWFRECFNPTNKSFDHLPVPYYNIGMEPRVLDIKIRAHDVIPIPSELPYVTNGICPHPLISVIALCHPFSSFLPKPTGMPTIFPHAPTATPTPTGQPTNQLLLYKHLREDGKDREMKSE